MGVLVGLPFAATFTFARTIAAPFRNSVGGIVTAPANVPRYDHSAPGERAGLLIESGGGFGRADALTVVAGDWADVNAATVLIEFRELETGAIRRRAVYATDVRAAVNACLNTAARHLMTVAVPGYLPNLGGFVRYRAKDWPLGDALATDRPENGGAVLRDTIDRLQIESA